MEGLLQHIEIRAKRPFGDLDIFLDQLRLYLRPKLAQILSVKHGIKFWLSIQVEYDHPTKDLIDPRPVYLHTSTLALTNDIQLDKAIEKAWDRIRLRNVHYNRNESGLVLVKINKARLKVVTFLPLIGRCENKKLPEFLSRKHATINVSNEDNRCFGYAVLSALYPNMRNAQRPSKYNHLFAPNHLDIIRYPVGTNQLASIEDMLQVNINVFSFYDSEGRARYPIWISEKNYDKVIDLLLWSDHYYWIKNFEGFMFDISNNSNKKHFCRKCLGHFSSQEILLKHQRYCEWLADAGQVIVMPPEGSELYFRNFPYVSLSLYYIV